jgi:hypothetical protein
VPSQAIQGQLQTQHSVDTGNYIMEQYNIKSKTNYGQALEKNTLMQKSKQTNKWSDDDDDDDDDNNNNFIYTNRWNYWEMRNVKYKYLE